MTLEYSVVIAPFTPEDGSGFLATVPDLPGRMTDGETPEQALAGPFCRMALKPYARIVWIDRKIRVYGLP